MMGEKYHPSSKRKWPKTFFLGPLFFRHPVALLVIVAFPVILALLVMYGMVSYACFFMLLRCWLRRAGCVSQDADILHNLSWNDKMLKCQNGASFGKWDLLCCNGIIPTSVQPCLLTSPITGPHLMPF